MISRKFSISAHVAELLTNCARTLFALRTLKQHGLPPEAVHTVFQAIVMAKINYASPAWWGFTSADDRGCLEAFYRRCARFGYCNNNTTIASMCDEADKRLFSKIINNPSHLLFPLLPPWNNITITCVNAIMITNFQTEPMPLKTAVF